VRVRQVQPLLYNEQLQLLARSTFCQLFRHNVYLLQWLLLLPPYVLGRLLKRQWSRYNALVLSLDQHFHCFLFQEEQRSRLMNSLPRLGNQTSAKLSTISLGMVSRGFWIYYVVDLKFLQIHWFLVVISILSILPVMPELFIESELRFMTIRLGPLPRRCIPCLLVSL
jgi:hypothetical protein